MVSAQNLTKGSFECLSPRFNSTTELPLSITGNGVDFFSSTIVEERVFRLVKQPTIYSFWPQAGSLKGGTKLVLSGGDFTEELKLMCSFNNVRVEAAWQSATQLTCITPPDTHDYGFASLSISDAYGNFHIYFQRTFVYTQEIQLRQLSPPSIPMNFNGVVRVFGDHFPSSPFWQCRANSATHEGIWISRPRYCVQSLPVLCRKVKTVPLPLVSMAKIERGSSYQRYFQLYGAVCGTTILLVHRNRSTAHRRNWVFK